MTLLLLAGTGDAKRIAQELVDRGVDAVASMAGATRDPLPLPLPTRVGGFGGADGFRAYLTDAGISAVIDATHPYAARITERTATICSELGIPYLLFLRPGWQSEPGDDWTEIQSEEDAAAHIDLGATVFLGTGRKTLERFANLAGRHVICRQIDPPNGPFPFEGGEFLVGRPPFSIEDEIALFGKLGVDWLIVKNAGGEASRTKLAAARTLGIPVLMLARPPAVDAQSVSTVAEVVAWVEAL